MRGRVAGSANLFSDVRLEERVPADHPLRPIRTLADEVLAGLNGRFEALYVRRRDPPERIARKDTLERHVAAWQKRRNAARTRVDWRFTTADARIKLRKLYPIL